MKLTDEGSVGEDIGRKDPPLTIQQLISALELMPNQDAYVRINMVVADERFAGLAGFVWAVEPCACDYTGCENSSLLGEGVLYDMPEVAA